MGLSDHRVSVSIAVSNITEARTFYEGKLGLSGVEDPHDESRTYACGSGTSLHVFPSPRAASSASTRATWIVEDLEQVVDELSASGVSFERYDEPSLQTDHRGIHMLGDGKVAWFKDPDGNTFAVEQRPATGP